VQDATHILEGFEAKRLGSMGKHGDKQHGTGVDVNLSSGRSSERKKGKKKIIFQTWGRRPWKEKSNKFNYK